MRLFIAIPLPRAFKRELASIQQTLRENSLAGRFVPADNFHITLHFIGESGDLGGAAAAMREAVRGIRPFPLHLAGFDSFDKGGAHTALLRVGGGLAELNALYESLESALFEQGFSREHRRFVPHITLARSLRFAPGGRAAMEARAMNASLQASSLVLFESRREEGRVLYLPLHTQRF